MEHLRRPILVYALLEIGIAIAALLVPAGLVLASRVQLALLGSVELAANSASLASSFFYLLTAFVVLMVPTALMGASLPVLARFAIEKDTQIGPRVSWLYAFNTGGAAAGTLLAAYGLLPRFGLDGTILVAVAVNVAVFILALLLARSAKEVSIERFSNVEARHFSPAGRWILPLILGSGFVSFCYEVLWTRLLSHLLGGTLYAFATMLATFLCGITLGAAVAGFFAKTTSSARRGFIVAQLGIALCFLLAFFFANQLPAMATGLGSGGGSFTRIALISAATLLPGALFMGATFPFAVRILAGTALDAGVASGRVFAWNTVGAILGAVATGFFLLPAFGFAGTVLIAVVTGLAIAVLTALLPKPRLQKWAIPAFACILLVIVWTPKSPTRVLRTSPLTGIPMQGELTFTAVGRSATTVLLKMGNGWRLTTNGLPESMIETRGSRASGVSIAHWLGLLPLASRPEAESALVIGFGAGRTLEAFAPSIKDLHVVELEPEVIHANQLMAKYRAYDPFTDPRLSIHLNDARSALLLSQQRFDAIISQPSHPWTSGASNLFTREFFELVRQRLNPDGVLVQWIGLPFVDEQLLLSLLASLNDVFDHVELYQPPPGGAVLFLASMQPPMSTASANRGLLNGGRLWSQLGIIDPQDILVARVLDSEASRSLSATAPINRDNHNLLRLRPPGKDFNQLNQQKLRKMIGDNDPLLGWQPEDGNLYLIRHLLAVKQVVRARQLISGIEDRNLAKIANSLLDLPLPKKQAAAVENLWQVLAAEPASDEAFYALMLQFQSAIAKQQPPARLAVRLVSDPVAAVIARGWQLGLLKNSAAIEKLDAQLARVSPRHPLYANAVRLRIAWRIAGREPQRAREALDLYEPLLAMGAANTQELFLRARLGAMAGQPETAIASLHEMVGKMRPEPAGHAHNEALANQAFKLLDALPAGAGLEPAVEDLRVRLKNPRIEQQAATDS